MASSLNRCEFIGNLGDDPEVRAMPNGDSVTKIRIACNWKSKNAEGVDWIPVVAFGKLADIMGQYLRKGSKVYIAGRFRTRKFQGQDGGDRYVTEIMADEMLMLDGRQGGEAREAYQPPAHGAAQDGAGHRPASGFDDFDGSDIPF